MTNQIAYDAAVRALVSRGLTENRAEIIIGLIRAKQPSEWQRMIVACGTGKLTRIYAVVTDRDDGSVDGLLYVPAGQDNIRHVMDFASQGPNIGSGPGDAEPAKETSLGYYPVSVFDIAPELRRVLQGAA